MRVIVDARNQPLPGDLPVMMELYSQLNQRLAGVCQEPEKSCIQSYQAYQACKSGASPANCAAPKDCTATCSLPSGAYAGLEATACSPPTGNPVTLYPIWNEEFARQDADRAKAADGGFTPQALPAGLGVAGGLAGGTQSHYAGWLSLRDMPGVPALMPGSGSATKSGSCSAANAYKWAQGLHAAHQDPAPFGFIPRTPIMAGNAAPTAAPLTGAARISGGVMAGNLLEKAQPVYPAVARAAHVSGAVVLHAIIAKDGTVKNLSVVSGPQLLQSAAVDAVQQWKYRPYLLNGTPTEVDTTITVNFNFEDPRPALPPPPPS